MVPWILSLDRLRTFETFSPELTPPSESTGPMRKANSPNFPMASRVSVESTEIQTISHIQHINVKLRISHYALCFCRKSRKRQLGGNIEASCSLGLQMHRTCSLWFYVNTSVYKLGVDSLIRDYTVFY